MTRRARRGVILMEVVLSLALVVVLGTVIVAAVADATRALRSAREKQVAVDLARSAMAKLEAGIETSTTLDGPVRGWTEDMNLAEVPEEAPATEWELEIQTQPTGFEGLTLVHVTAVRLSEQGVRGTSYTLRQLVRLAPKQEDEIGEKDDVTIEAEKANSSGSSNRRQRPSDEDEEREP